MTETSEYDELLRDYTSRITGQTDEAGLLASFPWSLGRADDLHALLKGLQLEAARFCEMPHQPIFSLIVPLSDMPPGSLDELILSVRCQSWFRWELILVDEGSERREHLLVAARWAQEDDRIRFLTIDRHRGRVAAKNEGVEAASGDFVCLLEESALLHPSALGVLARQWNAASEINFMFSHEARFDRVSKRIRKYIRKPEFDLFTLMRNEYIGHLTAIRADLLKTVLDSGKVFRAGYDGVEDHELMIRLALGGEVRSRCVPFFLYYSEALPRGNSPSPGADADLFGLTRNLIEEYLPQLYPGATWSIIPPGTAKGNQHPGIHLRSIPGHPRPSLLVIMPFKDQVELTLRCLDSLERQEHDLDVEVVMVNNRSRNPRTVPMLRSWSDRPRRNRYEIADDDGAFNFARINNRVFDRHGRSKDLILFLNNDTEILSSDCLQTMAMQALADETCGVVGIRLLYPDDGAIQHGGIKVWDNLLAICGFHQIDHARRDEEYVNDERISFGVTFAVAMMKRTTFERLGTLEEILYPNAYGDVAMCARAVEAGLKNYYFGTLLGLHSEMKTRGRSHEDLEYVAVFERYGPIFSHWMMRHLAYAEIGADESNGSSEASFASPFLQPLNQIPLRYKIADRINDTVKVALGPAQPALKRVLQRSWRVLRGIRSSRLRRPSSERQIPGKRIETVGRVLSGPHGKEDIDGNRVELKSATSGTDGRSPHAVRRIDHDRENEVLTGDF